MSDAMWGGRFDLPMDHLVQEFNATILIEKRVTPFSIIGSTAHVHMLAAQNILTQSEADTILQGLQAVRQEVEDGKFVFDVADEDIQMAIERRVTELVGAVGGKMHTARSRNDQAQLDVRLYTRHAIEEIIKAIRDLQRTIIAKAEQYMGVMFPGYTHFQTGQPILFSHWMMAYFWMLERDIGRFEDAYKRLNVCPLGAAAMAGTTFPIDREMTAKEMGFEGPSENSVDTIGDRDHLIETDSAAAICMMHLSRLCEEIVLFTSQDIHFFELSDDFCTGSSIMPNKKNPDIAEKIRGKAGRVFGNLQAMLTMMKGLPLAFNTDMSEDKEPTFDSVDTLHMSLRILKPMLEKMTVNAEQARVGAGRGYSNATDLADYLARKGIPFRQAHHIVGHIVNYCIKHNKDLERMTLEEYKQFSDAIEDDIHQFITLEACVAARRSFGGTAPERVKEQIERARARLALTHCGV